MAKIIGQAIQTHKEKEAKKDFVDRFLDVVMTWWHWIDGRRSDVGGYRIMTLVEWTPRMWLGIIRYRVGNHQPLHMDPLRKGFEGHFKINIELWKAKGSKFFTMYPHFNWGRIHIFWANHNPHQVTAPLEGTRYVLSFSWFTRKFKKPDSDQWYRDVYEYQKKLMAENSELGTQKHWSTLI